MLYTLGGVDTNSLNWKSNEFIPALALKQRFKTILLSLLRNEFAINNVSVPTYVKNEWQSKFNSSSFFNVQNKLWNNNWYVYIGEKLDNVDFTVSYIGRYAKRPSLAETKITYYSKKNNIVKFTYRDKITKEDKIVTLTINSFLGLIFRHIPEKNFHMIRYSGIYANARKNKIFKLISNKIISLFGMANLLFECARNKITSWRQRILNSTGSDPLKCKICNLSMSLTEIHYRIRDGTMKSIKFF
jgi:hypothetical protein